MARKNSRFGIGKNSEDLFDSSASGLTEQSILAAKLDARVAEAEVHVAQEVETNFVLLPATIFINEIHYDNTGTDSGEAIEIAGAAGTDLTGYSLVLYNGSTTATAATVYGTINLSGVIDDEGAGFGALSFALAANGLQNGLADGIALIGPGGVVLQFLSYEGVITAAAGTPAAGFTSTDMGVSENGAGAVGNSLRLTGTGSTGTDFVWQPEAVSSFGSINPGQIFAVAGTPGALAINSVSVAEGNAGGTNITFTVTRSGGSAGAVSASWNATFGSGAGNAEASDFLPLQPFTGTVSFADGVTTQTITLTVLGETISEPDENFTVTLSAPTGGASITTAIGTGTIINDDAAPGTLSIANASVTEGNAGTAPISFTVTRAGGSSGAVSATWTATFGAGGTSADAADFATGQLFTGTVNFADGEISQTITLNAQGDVVAEQSETFAVTLSAPTGGAALGTAAATGTITNDDVPPPANVFINEIHYDNASTDVGEAIEVAGLAGTDLTGWSLVLYNGNGGASYATIALSGVVADQNNGYGTISALATGIQNGPPDGIALVDNFNRVIQFLSYEGVMTATAGPASGLTSIDIGVSEESAPAAGLSLQLIGSGSSYADFTWVAAAADNFGAVNTGQSFLSTTGPSQFRVGDAGVAEGNSGPTTLSVIVYRAGGLSNAASVDFAITLDGTANMADLMPGAILTGTLNFAVGESQRVIQIPVQGDVSGEPNETLNISLSNPSGVNIITDPQAVGTIINDDPVPLTIMQIQGEAHQSAYIGQPVATTGIVTAVGANGFYLQDALGDANTRTSDAIFVFTSIAPTVAVGDSLSVSGTVAEFTGAAGSLSVTQINTPAVTVISSGNSLPAALLVGQGGRLPPTEWIDDDGLATYDPENDGIDFWESLEGMRITLHAPQVVANTNGFGETYVVASQGSGASGFDPFGGITVSPNSAAPGTSSGDFNPEMIQIDNDTAIFSGFTPNYTVRDQLSNVTGIVNYAFGAFEVIVTEAVSVTTDWTLARELTGLRGTSTDLTIATYNVENLDPTDTRFDLLATDIVFALQAPDIIGLQEIQDADGVGTGTNLSGTVTAQLLINAIVSAGGPTYTYIEVAPTTANTTGGEPNGNIRNGFLYNASRVNYISGSLTQISDSAFTNSRSPLVASFAFNGQVVTAINVHLTSRGGSEGLWGANQPPANAGEAARTAQLAAVNAYVNNNLATNPAYDVVLLGDFNGFYFEAEQRQLVENGGRLVNVGEFHLPEEELYSYLFEGNSQLLDNIYASTRLIGGSFYDAVHINALFNEATRPTDHDPQIARFTIAAGVTLFGDENPNILTGGSGNDTIIGLDSNDTIYGLSGDDRLDGSAGADYLSGFNGNDILWGGAGDDIMVGGDQDDTYYVEGNDIIVEYLNQGSDTVIASASYILTGGSYVEFLRTNDDNLTTAINLSGNELDNQIYGNAGVNQLFGNAGNDYLSGYLGNDELYGEDGNDSLYGDEGDDYLSGGDGLDRLEGSFGADIMLGGNGNDSYYADSSDLVVEYAVGGVDTVYAQSNFQMVAGVEIENLTIDPTFGSRNFNLFGNEFANNIIGVSGVNRIDGGLGNDTLTGGTNLDYFEFSTALGAANLDTILDFTSADDILLIDQRVFTGSGLSAGFLDAAAFLSGNGVTAATNAAHRFIHDSATGDIYYDADGVGGLDAIKFANIGSGTAMVYYDLYLI